MSDLRQRWRAAVGFDGDGRWDGFLQIGNDPGNGYTPADRGRVKGARAALKHAERRAAGQALARRVMQVEMGPDESLKSLSVRMGVDYQRLRTVLARYEPAALDLFRTRHRERSHRNSRWAGVVEHLHERGYGKIPIPADVTPRAFRLAVRNVLCFHKRTRGWKWITHIEGNVLEVRRGPLVSDGRNDSGQ